jgi:hypothetical protein
MGANVFRLPPTPCDGPGLLAQAGGSPSDPIRRRRTHEFRMACKRSGVRIPIAPQFRSIIRTDWTLRTAVKYSSVGWSAAARQFCCDLPAEQSISAACGRHETVGPLTG